jgi:hypothetical protein
MFPNWKNYSTISLEIVEEEQMEILVSPKCIYACN